ncbi:MAG: Hpt domain-containing protein [Candidatus Marinimicrobia bacterium]|nr:Hpt domain-containing protein [Candidatus Neomarinimicrobiota bacterium]
MTQVFNWDGLNAAADGDAELFGRLGEAFVESARETVAQLQAALAPFERQALGRAAHKLAGAAGLGGGGLLARRLRSLELAASTEAAPRLAERVAEIGRLVAQAEQERPT